MTMGRPSPKIEDAICKHVWSYTGVRFRNGKWNRPGSGSVNRYYGQHYLCTKCATTRIDVLRDQITSSYEPIQFNASPATADEFPIEDERGSLIDG